MTNYGNQSVYESLQKYFVKVCTLEGEGKTTTCAGTACIRTASSRKMPLKRGVIGPKNFRRRIVR